MCATRAAYPSDLADEEWALIEPTFGWLGRCRRLSKDYEQNTKSSEAMIYVAMIGIMVRRLAR
jgi:putative transposase